MGESGSSPSAGWYRDPTSRHDHRYWDGSEWTVHVADQGVSSEDPLAPSDGWSATADPAALVDAIIGEYKARADYAVKYQAEVARTGGYTKFGGSDSIRGEFEEIKRAGVADKACNALVGLGPVAVAPIVNALKLKVATADGPSGPDDITVRTGVAGVVGQTLARIDAAKAVELLGPMLSDPDARVQYVADTALYGIGTTDAQVLSERWRERHGHAGWPKK
jgi:hypothetical protein